MSRGGGGNSPNRETPDDIGRVGRTSCIGTASYQHDGNTRLFTSSTAVPGRWRAGARHNANIAECALST